ncbi:MAG: periplasmic heavy metal sensor [Pseudomonadota bacterium]|nr:periplasmic heavy metal sensor [Pseudomonadota bacterium]
MKLTGIHIVLAILLATAAGCLGAIAVEHWSGPAPGRSLHEFVHSELHLSADQETKLNLLESEFADERDAHEAKLRAANANLATAMQQEHTYGPKVSAAIDQVHVQMGELQKATVRHVFAMRSLLDEEQQKRFDRQISKSLTGDGRE